MSREREDKRDPLVVALVVRVKALMRRDGIRFARGLAQRSGARYSTVNKFLHNDVPKPGLSFLTRIAQAFGLTLVELLGDHMPRIREPRDTLRPPLRELVAVLEDQDDETLHLAVDLAKAWKRTAARRQSAERSEAAPTQRPKRRSKRKT